MRVYNYDELINPGDFMYYTRDGSDVHSGILYKCPCGCEVISAVPFFGEKVNWNWDGNEDKPSLTPSILKETPGVCKGWHGYLTKGVFVSC